MKHERVEIYAARFVLRPALSVELANVIIVNFFQKFCSRVKSKI